MDSLMDIWTDGRKMPFLVEHPDSGQTVVVNSYYWPKNFFSCEMNGVKINLTAEWQLWNFIKEA